MRLDERSSGCCSLAVRNSLGNSFCGSRMPRSVEDGLSSEIVSLSLGLEKPMLLGNRCHVAEEERNRGLVQDTATVSRDVNTNTLLLQSTKAEGRRTVPLERYRAAEKRRGKTTSIMIPLALPPPQRVSSSRPSTALLSGQPP